MAAEIADILREVVRRCDALLDLARDGDDAGGDVSCRLLFARMRDTAYELRRDAGQRLAERAASVLGATRGRRGVVEGLLRPKPEAEPSPGRESAPRADERRRVLIVEDQNDVATGLACWFRDRGFRVESVSDADAALRRVAADPPDLVTLDIRLSGGSGLSVLQALKSDAAQAVPVIVITGFGGSERRWLRLHDEVPRPDGFLAKPLEFQDLAALVRKLVA